MAVDEKYSSIILKRVFESQNPYEQVELVSDDGKRIPIHRVILTAASKYFAALLGPDRNFQEGDRNEGGKLERSNGETLKMIVNYCYTGHIKLTEENVPTILTIASYYQFDLLEEKCCSFYDEILSVTNSVQALMIADELSYAELRQAALDLICKNFESVPTADVQELDHQLFQEILKSDEITSSEELIFDRLVKWSEHEEKERKPYVPNLLKLIRLQHIKLEILINTFAAFYEKFDCIELMHTEYGRRDSDYHFASRFRRYPSVFCLFMKYGEGRLEPSVIKVCRFETRSMPTHFEDIVEIVLGKRTSFTVVKNQNKIYVLGGRMDGVFCNTVSSFDLNSRQEEILPNMNIIREDCTSILFGEYVYVFGGENDSGFLNSCERFDTKRKTWIEIASLSQARTYASAVVMNGCIYIAGGWGNDDYATRSFESYDPMKNEWKELAPMICPRYNLALIQSYGFIYAIGGGSADIVEKYDPSKNQWTMILHLGRSGSITSGINANDKIYVMGSDRVQQFNEDDEDDDNYWFSPTEINARAYISEFREHNFLTLN